MTPRESLYYALGELAYATAQIDGKIQKEEREKFHEIVVSELEKADYNINVTDIIFQLMEKDKTDPETSYEWAMKEIKLNSHYLSPKLKDCFVRVMEKIASAYPPITIDEQHILEKFKKDIEPIHGDPVYYTSN